MKEIIIEVPDRFGHELKPYKINSEIKGELVRCKDCKHGYKCEFDIRCENKNMPSMFGQHFPYNWFCANGERREAND